jgi:hypothetical protein
MTIPPSLIEPTSVLQSSSGLPVTKTASPNNPIGDGLQKIESEEAKTNQELEDTSSNVVVSTLTSKNDHVVDFGTSSPENVVDEASSPRSNIFMSGMGDRSTNPMREDVSSGSPITTTTETEATTKNEAKTALKDLSDQLIDQGQSLTELPQVPNGSVLFKPTTQELSSSAPTTATTIVFNSLESGTSIIEDMLTKGISSTRRSDEVTVESESFLAPRVSSGAAASRPYDLPRVAPANIIEPQAGLGIEQPDSLVIIQDGKIKRNRQSDSSNSLPGMNDILTGLLNVVGEGLTIATNYVKEENERKKEAKLAREKEASESAAKASASAAIEASISAVPAFLNPGRINNRGPPRFTEIPFEAIPLEILSSQRPGQKPVQIQQRPFHTRIKITKTKLINNSWPPYETGIPLPEVLIPGYELPPTTSTTTETPTTTTGQEKVEKNQDTNRISIETPTTSAPSHLSKSGGSRRPSSNPTSGSRRPSSNPTAVSRRPSSKPTAGSRRPTLPGGRNQIAIKLQNQFVENKFPNLQSDLIHMMVKPSSTISTIMATATQTGPSFPQRPQWPRRPPPIHAPTIKTPPLRPFNRPNHQENTIVVDPPNRVFVTGTAYDVIRPSRNPDVFDLTVVAQQNFGGAGGPIRPVMGNPGKLRVLLHLVFWMTILNPPLASLPHSPPTICNLF